MAGRNELSKLDSIKSDDALIATPPSSPDTTPKNRVAMRSRVTVVATQDATPSEVLSPLSTATGHYSAGGSTTHSALTHRQGSAGRRISRSRAPGGAFAKLLGPVEHDSSRGSFNDGDTSGDDLGILSAATGELDVVRKKAKEEFIKGTRENRRYQPPTTEEGKTDSGSVISESSLPSILNRSEVFHESATAAVLAMLMPRRNRDVGDNSSLVSGLSETGPLFSDAGASVVSAQPSTISRSYSAFTAPNKQTDSLPPGVSYLDVHQNPPKMPTTKPLVSEKTEEKLETISKKMKNPSKTLSDLLTSIASPDDGSPMDRGYMVRRKNACGALRVLTSVEKNRRPICWTVGVLPALRSVLEDSGDSLENMYPDVPTRREFVDARKRAVASLVNLAGPKENRLAVFYCPDLVQQLICVIEQDTGESRQGCCAVLAYLAKTGENRLLMAQVPGLIDAAVGVIKPEQPEIETKKSKTGRAFFGSQSASHSEDSDDVSESGSEVSEHTDDSVSTEESRRSLRARTTGSESSRTLKTAPSPSTSAARKYDEDPNEFLRGARQNVFALLTHLLKEKDNAYFLVRHVELVSTLVEISYLDDSPAQAFAVKMLANFTRHRQNSKFVVLKLQNVVPALVNATYSNSDESRLYACYALQNVSCDKSCRQEVATTKNLITALCLRARNANHADEKLAAISALKNLTEEPANLIPLTNTPECFATLMQIAHGVDDSVTERMQYLACDAVASLSHWLRKIATSGQAMEAERVGGSMPRGLFVPSLRIVSWEQWK